MSAAGRMLSKLLDETEGWKFTNHFTYHVPSKTMWWTCSGAWFFNGYGDSCYADMYEGCASAKCLGRVERHRLYWKAKRLVNRLEAEKMYNYIISA